MSIILKLEDKEGVIKGPHYYLIEQHSLDDLEREIYAIITEEKTIPLSAIWRRLNCHLWEVVAALKRLKDKGLVEETEVTEQAYRK